MYLKGETSGVCAGLGAFVGLVCGFLADASADIRFSVMTSAFSAAAVGCVIASIRRKSGRPRVAVHALAPAGAIAGLAAGLATNATFSTGSIYLILGCAVGLLTSAVVAGAVGNRWRLPGLPPESHHAVSALVSHHAKLTIQPRKSATDAMQPSAGDAANCETLVGGSYSSLVEEERATLREHLRDACLSSGPRRNEQRIASGTDSD